MKRKFPFFPAIAVVLLSAVAILLFGGMVAHAQTIRSGGSLSVSSSQTIDSGYFAAGHSVDIAGTVNGDVICGTQNLTVSGTVHGDVLCGAETITITGHVDGNVRLAGQSINLDGSVGKNASVIGQDVSLGGKSTVSGDLSFAGSSLTSNGTVGRDMALAAQNATINGTVMRNVTGTVQHLAVDSGATINGHLEYTSPNSANIDSGAHVGGVQHNKTTEHNTRHNGFKGLAFFLLWFVLAALFCSLILVLIAPLFFWTTSQEAISRPGWTILTGFLTSIILPIVTVIAFATIIGIPLGFLLLFFGFTLFLFSFPVAAFYLGRLLFATWMNRDHNAIVLMLLGALALVILLLIPFVDFIAWILMIWFGYGSIILALRHRMARPTYHIPTNFVIKPAKSQ